MGTRFLPLLALATVATTAIALLATREAVPQDAEAPEGDLVLKATLRRSTVRLGDEVAIDLVVSNRSSRATPVPRLWLASDAVAVRIGWEGETRAVIERRRGGFELKDDKLVFTQKKSLTKPLGPGAELTGTVRFAVVRTGELTVRPLLSIAGETDALLGPELELKVNVGRRGGKIPAVTVETTKGTLRVELQPDRAFNTVSAFWTLARSGFYDGLPFHRIVERTLVQTGDPTGSGGGNAGWYLPAEGSTQRIAQGDVCLARGPHADSSSSQWFAYAGKTAQQYEAGFNPLGVVSEGLDVLEALAATKVDPETGRPVDPPVVKRLKLVSP